jgi:hypothetical protein
MIKYENINLVKQLEAIKTQSKLDEVEFQKINAKNAEII